MKFEKIHIDGFGALKNLDFDEISPTLTIVEGANEAGKSTLLEFVRSLFFGFVRADKDTDNAKRYEPLDGGAHGGWAILQTQQNEKVRVERQKGTTSPGSLSLELLGQQQGISAEDLWGNIDRDLYERVFAFSLDELSDLEKTNDAMKKRVYSGASGGMGTQLHKAISETERQYTEIFTKGGKKRKLNLPLENNKTLKTQIKEKSQDIETYNADIGALKEQSQRLEELNKTQQQARERHKKAEQLKKAWTPWLEIKDAQTQLADLQDSSGFSDVLVGQMEELQRNIEGNRKARERSSNTQEELEKKIETLQPNEAILDNAARINSLHQQLSSVSSQREQIIKTTAQWEKAKAELTQELEKLGPQWDEEKLLALDTSHEVRQYAQSQVHRFEAQQTAQDEANRKLQFTTEQRKEQQTAIEEKQTALKSTFERKPPTSQDIAQQEKLIKKAHELLQQQSSQELLLNEARQQLQEHTNTPPDNEQEDILPTWTVAIPLCLTALSLLAIFLMPVPAIIGAVIFALLSGGLWWFIADRRTKAKKVLLDRQKNYQDKQQELQEKVDQYDVKKHTLQRQIDKIAEELKTEITTETLQKRDERLRQMRDDRWRYESLQQDFQDAAKALEITEQKCQREQTESESCKSTFAQLQQSWNDWLKEHALPHDKLPAELPQFLADVDSARKAIRAREALAEELDLMKQNVENFEKRCNVLFEELDSPPKSGQSLEVHIHSLAKQVQEQTTLKVRRDSELDNLEAIKNNRRLEEQENKTLDQQNSELLEQLHCADQSKYLEKLDAFQKRKKLKQQLESSRKELINIFGPTGVDEEKLRRDFEDKDQIALESTLKDAEQALREAEEQLRQANVQQGQLQERVERWNAGQSKITTLSRRQQEQKTVIADYARQWIVARTANVLLEETRLKFEKERQPRIIKRAAEMMQTLSCGRYDSVIAGDKLNAVELSEGEHGRKSSHFWSRGTREQFYTALRLSYIEDYCEHKHAGALPVVMDDILVHADGYERLKAAAKLIGNFALNYQVLYFTCRPGDAAILAQHAPEARHFRLEGSAIKRV